MGAPLVTARCCGAGCDYEGAEGEPCWGEIAVVDEVEHANGEGGTDWSWVHVCDGHRDRYNGGAYKPPPQGVNHNGVNHT
jgi:hypothetical protein